MGIDDERAGKGSPLEEECALWDWTRTAGVSAAELRDALGKSLRRAEVTVCDATPAFSD